MALTIADDNFTLLIYFLFFYGAAPYPTVHGGIWLGVGWGVGSVDN